MGEKIYPPTADETDKCPPHHYVFDNLNVGRCIKPGCTAVQDCRTLINKKQDARAIIYEAKTKKGGRKRHEAREKV